MFENYLPNNYVASLDLLKVNQNNTFLVRKLSAKVMEVIPYINCCVMFNTTTIYKYTNKCTTKYIKISTARPSYAWFCSWQ